METKNRVGEKKTQEIYTVKGDWNKQAKALREKYPTLTNEDVKFESGKEKDLFNRLERKLHKNHNEVIGILETNYEACC